MRLFTCIALCFVLGFTDALSSSGRIYTNAFNNNSLDLYILASESDNGLNFQTHLRLRGFIIKVIESLYPPGSSTRFSVGFYGATNRTRWAVQPSLTIAQLAMANLYSFQFSTTRQSDPGDLRRTLEEFKAVCSSGLRQNVPRVLVIIDPEFYDVSRDEIRDIENNCSITVITIGVGDRIDQSQVASLASEPGDRFGTKIINYDELPAHSTAIVILISEVPRLVNIGGQFEISDLRMGSDYVMQVRLPESTSANILISLTLQCATCNVFGSTNEPRPTISNTNPLSTSQSVLSLPSGVVYYFRVISRSTRVFFNVQRINGTGIVRGWLDTFTVTDI